MKISKPFGKKEEKQEKIDELIAEGAKEFEEGEVGVFEEKKPEAVDIRKVGMDVDFLKAKAEAFVQMNKVMSDRQAAVSEEIGDLRRKNIELEKNVIRLAAEAEKASSLVKSVQPENLMIEVKKVETKNEMLSAKLDAEKKKFDYVAEELKTIRRDISAFRGVESIIKLNEDVKNEIYNVKKSEASAQKHADRVESIYIKSEKSFSEFLRLKDEMTVLESSLREVTKELTKIRSDTKALVSKSDIASLQKDVHKELDEIREFTKRIDKEKIDGIKKDIEAYKNSLEEKIKSVSGMEVMFKDWYDVFVEDTESKKFLAGIKEIEKRIQALESNVQALPQGGGKPAGECVTRQEFDKELNDMFKSILEKLDGQKEYIDKKMRKK